MKERLLQFFQKTLAVFQDKKFKVPDEWIVFFIQGIFVCFISLIAASMTSSFFIPFFVHPFLQADLIPKTHPTVSLASGEKINYLVVKKTILNRNVFNRSGELPKEEDEKISTSNVGKAFDDSTPCVPTKVKATLLGTVFSDTGKSYAVVQETGYEFSDIYSVGDLIIGSDASIVRIERNQVILNHAGRKECLQTKGFDELAKTESAGGSSAGGAPVVLGSKWVTGELGEGFSKIIQTAHIVPNAEGEKVNGYKIFGIESGTLFDKVGLKDGDIVVQVNRVQLDANNGFSLYQAFLEARDIVIDVLRQGKDPATIHVKIE